MEKEIGMKRVCLAVVFAVCITPCFAASLVKSAGSTDAGVYIVNPSSTTPTLALAANSQRRGVAIKNNCGTGVNLFVSTSTTSAGYGPIANAAEYSDDIESYQGALYVVVSSTYTGEVRVFEKSSSNY